MAEQDRRQKARLKPGTSDRRPEPRPPASSSRSACRRTPRSWSRLRPSWSSCSSTRGPSWRPSCRPRWQGLRPGAAIWVVLPQGRHAAAGLDMSRDSVWAIAEQLGLRPLGAAEHRRDLVGLPTAAAR